jgi:hypothetical protein
MIRALLLRLNYPGLHIAFLALKELRKLVYCLALGKPDLRRIGRIKTRLHGILQKTDTKNIQLIRSIERITRLVEKSFLEISDYKLAATHETVWFFNLYISLLDTIGKVITGCSSKSGEETAKAGGLIAAGRKQLRLFKAGLSQPDDFLSNLKLATLYNDFDKWLDESEKLLENIIVITKVHGSAV